MEFDDVLHVPAEHPTYAGHFPGNPVVPGALLLGWLQDRAEQLAAVQVIEVASIKFIAEVKPGAKLTLAGRYSEESGRLALEVSDGGPVCKVILRTSTGRGN